MLLLISGEGPTDMGAHDGNHFLPGPMAIFVDQWLQARIGYSLIDINMVELFTEKKLIEKSKHIKPLSRRGKKKPQETRYFYKNARALAKIALEREKVENTDVLVVLFRDADGTVSSGRGEWLDKYNSMLNGFNVENFDFGVPMLPKPKSEAWVLCALQKKYQNCNHLEDASGNDKSPYSLKKQLEEYLGVPANRNLLLEKIDRGLLDMKKINMPSMQAFKNRCDDVLNLLNIPGR